MYDVGSLDILIGQDDEYSVLRAIESGAEIHRRTDHDLTPLMLASLAGMDRAVEALIDAGADVNAMSRPGISVLMHASSLPRARIVRKLIANGANVNAIGAEGRTALLCAVWSAESTPAVVSELVKGGADKLVRDLTHGLTPLEWARKAGRLKVAEALSKSGP